MPTTSRSSPTTTSAVNENRRPPLTTLATRLISTTRSWRSSPAEETERSRAMGEVQVSGLELEAALAGALGQGLHSAVVLIAAAVEHRGLDAGRARTLGQHGSDALGLVHRRERAQLGLGPLRRGQGPAGDVVDELGGDPAVGAKDGDAGTLGRAADLGAHAAAALETTLRCREGAHARLPTFRATYSPS